MMISAWEGYRTRLFLLPLFWVTALACLSSCDSSNTDMASAAEEGKGLSPTGSLAPLPLMPALRREEAFDIALGQLLASNTQACMNGLGFDYTIDTPRTIPDLSSEADVVASRYGAPRRSVDGKLGYVRKDSPVEIAPEGAPSPDDYARALAGSNVASSKLVGVDGATWAEVRVGDGCSGDALVIIFGSIDNFVDFAERRALVDSASSISIDQLVAQAGAIAESRAWAKCVRSRGLELDTPFDAETMDWQSPRPGDDEQAAAAIDLACRESAGLDGALTAADGTIQSELLAEQTDAVRDLVAIYDEIISMGRSTYG